MQALDYTIIGAYLVVLAVIGLILTFLIPMGLVLGLWSAVLPATVLWAGLFAGLIRNVQKAGTETRLA